MSGTAFVIEKLGQALAQAELVHAEQTRQLEAAHARIAELERPQSSGDHDEVQGRPAEAVADDGRLGVAGLSQ